MEQTSLGPELKALHSRVWGHSLEFGFRRDTKINNFMEHDWQMRKVVFPRKKKHEVLMRRIAFVSRKQVDAQDAQSNTKKKIIVFKVPEQENQNHIR